MRQEAAVICVEVVVVARELWIVSVEEVEARNVQQQQIQIPGHFVHEKAVVLAEVEAPTVLVKEVV